MGRFFKGLFTGGLAGFIAGILTAPQPGEKTREQLTKAAERARELSEEVKEKGEELKGKAEKILKKEPPRKEK